VPSSSATLIDRGNGLQVHPDWPGPGIAPEEVIDRLRPGHGGIFQFHEQFVEKALEFLAK